MKSNLFNLAQNFIKKYSVNNEINLTSLKELSYSAVMRELRKQSSDETVRDFLIIFKRIFDALLLKGEKDLDAKAMPAAIIMFAKKYPMKLNKEKI